MIYYYKKKKGLPSRLKHIARLLKAQGSPLDGKQDK